MCDGGNHLRKAFHIMQVQDELTWELVSLALYSVCMPNNICKPYHWELVFRTYKQLITFEVSHKPPKHCTLRENILRECFHAVLQWDPLQVAGFRVILYKMHSRGRSILPPERLLEGSPRGFWAKRQLLMAPLWLRLGAFSSPLELCLQGSSLGAQFGSNCIVPFRYISIPMRLPLAVLLLSWTRGTGVQSKDCFGSKKPLFSYIIGLFDSQWLYLILYLAYSQR